MTKSTLLADVKASSWLPFFGCLVMWAQEYPHLKIVHELGRQHNVVGPWMEKFQDAAASYIADKISLPKLHGTFKKRDKARGKKGVKKTISKKKQATFIVQADEVFHHKSKVSRLAPGTRPKKKQAWLRGAVVQGSPEHFVFRVLEHPEDALDGRPRGKEEMVTNFDTLGLREGMAVATDGWRATIAAVEHIKDRDGWSDRDLKHEIVVHPKREVKHQRGFTTTHIENRWWVPKRWLKKRLGGRLPTTSDRRKWARWVTELQYRNAVAKSHSMDGGHAYSLPTKAFLSHVAEVTRAGRGALTRRVISRLGSACDAGNMLGSWAHGVRTGAAVFAAQELRLVRGPAQPAAVAAAFGAAAAPAGGPPTAAPDASGLFGRHETGGTSDLFGDGFPSMSTPTGVFGTGAPQSPKATPGDVSSLF
ncbi:unnamed protein product [Prorocentrum cordatum]|uniref:Uncharacterized protein n=1 Tax=Prorocentrum cordatum TaxID=2364126 RepID=A0ABN9U8N4_9DINO|nr:unnamed protein product [Polarella glacialis]